MNEPGASKQITQYQNNNHIQQIRKRKLEEAKLKLRTDVVEASLNPGSPKNEDSVEEFGQDFSISENKSTGEVKNPYEKVNQEMGQVDLVITGLKHKK